MRNLKEVVGALSVHWGPRIVFVSAMDVVELYESDRELFFALGCLDEPAQAAPWIREAWALVLRFRAFAERGIYDLKLLRRGTLENKFDTPVQFPPDEAARVARMLQRFSHAVAADAGGGRGG